MKRFVLFFALQLIALVAPTTPIRAQTDTPKLEIVTPANGQTIYGNSIPTIFSIENFTLVANKDPKLPVNSQGYINLWLDSQTQTAENATKLTQDTFTFADVANAEHTLTAELVNADGKSLTPKQVAKVNFKSEALIPPTPPKEAGFDKNTTLVILLIVALVITAAWYYTKDDEETPIKNLKTAPQKNTAKRKIKKKK